MDDRILAQLGIITNEEAQLLSGRSSIDRSIYMNDGSRDVITGKKLLDQGKRREAVKLINDTAAEIWDKAAGLLKLNINK